MEFVGRVDAGLLAFVPYLFVFLRAFLFCFKLRLHRAFYVPAVFTPLIFSISADQETPLIYCEIVRFTPCSPDIIGTRRGDSL